MPGRLKALSFRRPEETSPRMRALSRLPVFLSLEGKRALVCGNASAAAWKAELQNCCRPQAPTWMSSVMRPAKSCTRSPPTHRAVRFRSRPAPGGPVISPAPPSPSAP